MICRDMHWRRSVQVCVAATENEPGFWLGFAIFGCWFWRCGTWCWCCGTCFWFCCRACPPRAKSTNLVGAPDLPGGCGCHSWKRPKCTFEAEAWFRTAWWRCSLGRRAWHFSISGRAGRQRGFVRKGQKSLRARRALSWLFCTYKQKSPQESTQTTPKMTHVTKILRFIHICTQSLYHESRHCTTLPDRTRDLRWVRIIMGQTGETETPHASIINACPRPAPE